MSEVDMSDVGLVWSPTVGEWVESWPDAWSWGPPARPYVESWTPAATAPVPLGQLSLRDWVEATHIDPIAGGAWLTRPSEG